MQSYALSHVQDSVLLQDLASLAAHDRVTTAVFLAHIAEVDARKLFVPAGYSSMFVYCVEELHLSESATAKRIQAARAARRFPALFTALAEGRLHLTAVRLLAPHLTPANVDQLIEVATHRRQSEIEELLARLFSAAPPRVRLLTPIAIQPTQHAARHVDKVSATLDAFDQHASEGFPEDVSAQSNAPSEGGTSSEHYAGHVPRLQPQAQSAPERFLLQLAIDRPTRDKLQYAIALLSHSVPNGDAAQVFGRALDALITNLEKRKFGGRLERASLE